MIKKTAAVMFTALAATAISSVAPAAAEVSAPVASTGSDAFPIQGLIGSVVQILGNIGTGSRELLRNPSPEGLPGWTG